MNQMVILLLCSILMIGMNFSENSKEENELNDCLEGKAALTQKICYKESPDKPLTLKAVLKGLNARCRDKKLYNGDNKEIVFLRVRPVGKREGLCADAKVEDFKYDNIVREMDGKIFITLNMCANILLK